MMRCAVFLPMPGMALMRGHVGGGDGGQPFRRRQGGDAGHGRLAADARDRDQLFEQGFLLGGEEAVHDHVLVLDLQHGVQQHILVRTQVLEAGDRNEHLQDQAGARIDENAPGVELEYFPAHGGDHLTFTPWQ